MTWLMPSKQGRVVLILTLFALVTTALCQDVELESRVFDLARQLRCPVCTSESVADSSADTSIEMRTIIQEQVAAGKTDAEILAFFQERYGDWILLSPPKRGLHLLVWLLPVIAGLIGSATLAVFFKQWVARSRQVIDVNDSERQRVRDAMEQQ